MLIYEVLDVKIKLNNLKAQQKAFKAAFLIKTDGK